MKLQELIEKLKEVSSWVWDREVEEYANTIEQAIELLEKLQAESEVKIQMELIAMKLDPLCGR